MRFQNCGLAKKRGKPRGGEVWRGVVRQRSKRDEAKIGTRFATFREGRRTWRNGNAVHADRPSVPSVKRNSILRNGGFQGLNVYGEEGLTSLSIEFRTRGEKDLK